MKKEEITNEVKAKVFAQYFGQQILISETHRGPYGLVNDFALKLILSGKQDSLTLVLKPLSKISDEDATEIAVIWKSDDIKEKPMLLPVVGRWIIKGLFTDEVEEKRRKLSRAEFKKEIERVIFTSEFLKSKGYDLPNFHLNGKTLHECNLCVHEQ